MKSDNKLFYVGMALGFALAFGLLLLIMPYMREAAEKYAPGGTAAGAAPVEKIDDAAVREFFRALEAGDFAAMKTTGEKAFVPGKTFPRSKVVLAFHEVNSDPPYLVYAFFTENTDEKARRVLLTMKDDDTVVSFLAEEMKIVP